MQTKSEDKVNRKTPERPKEKLSSIPQWPAGLSLSRDGDIDVSIPEDLAVLLSNEAFDQLFGWAYSTLREISCLGSVRRDGNRFLIERFYLLKQSGSSASTELDQSAVAELIEQLIAEGRQEEAQHIKCWAHSHPNMDAFWSKTDEDTCRLLVGDYLVSIVVASNFAARCRIDIAAPMSIVFDNIPVLFQIPKDKVLMDKHAQEVRSVVSEKTFNFSKTEQEQERDKFIPTSYCDYCGNWHAEGECPLADLDQWPNIDEDNFMF